MWDLNEIKAGGIAAILSVNRGDAVHESMLSNLGIAYSNVPMSSNAPVRNGDKEICLANLPKAMEFIRENYDKWSCLSPLPLWKRPNWNGIGCLLN